MFQEVLRSGDAGATLDTIVCVRVFPRARTPIRVATKRKLHGTARAFPARARHRTATQRTVPYRNTPVTRGFRGVVNYLSK